jgi:nitroimidazol reductase NimA-like FMN-containing flavoprotein (pyridoxamine 5'-phosphate oxidase superfamily)
MTIATVRPDGWPQTTMVGYANEGWRIYFLIYRSSQKFENISKDNRVSVSVGHEPGSLSDIKAVYAGCNAEEVTDLAEKNLAWKATPSLMPAIGSSSSQVTGSISTVVNNTRSLRWRTVRSCSPFSSKTDSTPARQARWPASRTR